MEAEAFITTIKIFSRADCINETWAQDCIDQYGNIKFGVGDISQTDASDPPVDCATFPGPITTPGETISVKCDKYTTRYVYARGTANKYLSICEMEAWGRIPSMYFIKLFFCRVNFLIKFN